MFLPVPLGFGPRSPLGEENNSLPFNIKPIPTAKEWNGSWL